MSDHEDSKAESLMEKISEKIDGHKNSSSSSSSSSSDSDEDRRVSSVKSKVFRRETPVHNVFGGGKAANVFLWRDKKVSAGVIGGVTAIWFLFEVLGYGLLTLVCHGLILSLSILFLWSNGSTFINKSPPKIPKIVVPEEPLRQILADLRAEINRGFAILRDIASGRDLKKLLTLIASLWFVSIIGSCCNFLTLFYILLVLLFTVPVTYEKYKDQIDPFAEKARIEIKKQYAAFDEKVLSKIPRSLKDKKKA